MISHCWYICNFSLRRQRLLTC